MKTTGSTGKRATAAKKVPPADGGARHEETLRQLNAVYSKEKDLGESRLVESIKTKVRRTIRERW